MVSRKRTPKPSTTTAQNSLLLPRRAFRCTSGSFYLSPFPAYLNYVIHKAPKAADAGIGVVYPKGEHDKTQEAEIVGHAVEEAQALASSMRALSELEGSAFEKFLIDRCLRNAVYAATTQFELVNWSEREARNGRDPSQLSNYGEKVSRKMVFMTTAGALFSIIRDAFPNADLSAAAFERTAKRVIYDTARIEASKLKSPKQISQDQQAGVDAARIVAEDF
jgi:hypothetical protein